jgi:hypothetical protein
MDTGEPRNEFEVFGLLFAGVPGKEGGSEGTEVSGLMSDML